MKFINNRSPLFKCFFYLESVLLFSLFISFLSGLILEKPQNRNGGKNFYRHVRSDYRLLNHFLRFNSFKESDPTGNPPSDFSQEENEQIIRQLYSQRKYQNCIDFLHKYPLESLEIKILLINALGKVGNSDKAFSMFKDIFCKNNIQPFKTLMSKNQLNQYLSKLDFDYWFKKFSYLIQNNYYSEFLRESRYVKARQMNRFFRAKQAYHSKRYSRTQRLLKLVTDKKLSAYKEEILIKTDIQQDRLQGILDRIYELKNWANYQQLLFDAATLFLIKNRLDYSLKLFVDFLSEGERSTEKYWKAVWLSAWISFRLNETENVIDLLGKGSSSPFRSYRIPSLYWSLKFSKAEFSELANYPFTYYYTKAANEKMVSRPTNRAFLGLFASDHSKLFHNIIENLKELFHHQGFDQCLDLVQAYKQDPRLTSSDKNMLKLIESILFLRQKKYYHAFVRFKENFRCYQCLHLPSFLSHIYLPIEYEEIIFKYSEQNRIDPYLLFSLVREETFFRPDLISTSGARGLMQILPRTGRDIASRKGMRIRSRDLYNPEINIKLGTTYLRQLLDKYDGRMYLALAAYNAGDHRVDKWIGEIEDVDSDLFIEMIPFTETRSYVKNVLRNYFYYRYYYAQN